MRLSQPLDDLLRNRSHVRVLRALTGLPTGIAGSIREIARRAGISHPAASNVLESLRQQGIVKGRRTLLADEYALNEDHALTSHVRGLFRMERSLLDDVLGFLAKEVRSEAGWITEGYLFGSATRSDMNPNSDLDIAIICPPGREAQAEAMLEELSDRTAERFGNRLHWVIGTRPMVELAKAGRPGYRLWRTVALEGHRFIPADHRVRALA